MAIWGIHVEFQHCTFLDLPSMLKLFVPSTRLWGVFTLNPDGQKSVKDLFNGAAKVHGDIEQWRSAHGPLGDVRQRQRCQGFHVPTQFKHWCCSLVSPKRKTSRWLTSGFFPSLHHPSLILVPLERRVCLPCRRFIVAGRGLDPVECIRQVSPSAISSTVIRWVSKPLQNIIHVALALLGAPVFLGLGQEKTDTTTTLCFVTQDCFPKSMDPSQRTPLSQNVTKSLRNNVLPIVWISLFSL